ncbi:Creatinase/aminopeptidase [Metschnikowia bicuspidata var. bicuspidata NRRL YB-4993]|uniref:Creatinase/aminopeptidase n=1 Tax=Metschnikowia bicuspidata var. bicuspidata NRRL YB-4993 TaxID=869754 RepID=A0A1A0HJD7_9ASCO|nr:Creatinase/aminopeptidase [Metschnikowia bicuspidata var. bicuspidata NRRL YB-4993]OBA23953.1 Creatinase/aminopeptidase [Metschnikowia bicuspidata var. bicuspidata NRRL YB-4993]
MSSKELESDISIANPDVVAKYKVGGNISNHAIETVRAAVKEGAKVFDLCELGDKTMTDALRSSVGKKISKGIAFPTCVNPNNIPAHCSPENSQDETNFTLKNGDVVNIMLGVQIEGYPAIIAETLVVGESADSPVTGQKADLLHSAWNASEAAIRLLKPGNKNWEITNTVDKIAKSFGTSAVQSMLSHNMEKDVLYGSKEIILNPSKEHKNQVETYVFKESEVYGLDILISTSGEGKVKKSKYRTTLHKLTGNNYSLRLKTSQDALKQFREKVTGPFPANVKIFDEPRKVRVGLIECSNHEVVLPYDIMEDKSSEFIAQYFTTVAITPEGLVKLTSPGFNDTFYRTEKKLEDEEILSLIATPLPPQGKNKKKKKKQNVASQPE